MTEEGKFKERYIEEYQKLILASYHKLKIIKEDYPEKLISQIDYYEGLIINSGNELVDEVVKTYKINLEDIFGEGFNREFMINELILKTWSIQKSLVEDFEKIKNDLLEN